MTNPRYPELIGEIGHRGDTTDGRPPPGIKVQPGTWQGGAAQLTAARLAQVPELQGDLGRRGDLSGGQVQHQPRDPYATRFGHDLKADWDWLQFCATLPADPIPLTGNLSGQLIETGRQILMGGSLVCGGTTAATWSIYDGYDATGTLIARVQVPASGTAPLTLPAAGVLAESGLFATSTGTFVIGAVYIVHLWKYPFTPPGE